MRLTLSIVDKAIIVFFCCSTFTFISVITGSPGGGGTANIRIDEAGGGGENVDKKAVLTRPLNQGIYQFHEDGSVPKQPLKRLRVVHSEMISTLRAVNDPSKLLRYLLSIASTVHDDVETLRRKFEEAGVGEDGKQFNRKSLKADAFVFLSGHAALISHIILYFPDVIRKLFRKNAKLEENAKWVIRFVADAHLVNEEKTLEIINLAQQELHMIPRDDDFQNPYRLEEFLKMEQKEQLSTTTTKKPRKRLQRGPRLTGAEL